MMLMRNRRRYHLLLWLSLLFIKTSSTSCLSCVILSLVVFSVLRRETLVPSGSSGMPTVKEKEDNIYI